MVHESPEHGEEPRGALRPLRSLNVAVWVGLVLCWGGLVGSGFSQQVPPSARPADTTPMLSSVQGGEDPRAAAPAGKQGPEWSPYQPSLAHESDCFVDAEVALVFPQLHSLLTAPVSLTAGGPLNLVSLHNARLDPTASPLFQLGGFR